ncbi:MAG: LamG-like jellyroll fold domain-containing protein, partial [Lentisphaeria bacterium]|nr:LamG-like jellyroll fold domain-containing protein [Lentisphaeria bacterium]
MKSCFYSTLFLLFAISTVLGGMQLAVHAGGISLGRSQAEVVNVSRVPAPSRAWKFPRQGEKRLTFNNLPDWGEEGFSAELWCMPTEPECGYALLMRGSFGFPKFYSDENYDNYLVSSTSGKNVAGRVYCGSLLDEYHYFCITGDKEQISNYLDGKLMRTDQGMGVPAYQSQNTLYVGESIGWAKNNFAGEIALIRIYKTTLNAQKILEHNELLKNDLPLPRYQELVFEEDRRETGEFWKFQDASSLKFNALELPEEQSMELAFALQFRAAGDAELVKIGDFLSLRLDKQGHIHGNFAGFSFKSEAGLESERLYKVKLAWNGGYAQVFCDEQALGYAEAVELDRLPKTVNLQIGGGFNGIIGQFSISENRTLPAELGQWVSEKLNNDSVDSFSHPPIRHIAGKPEKDKPLVGFEDLQEWTASYQMGAVKPIFTRSKEEPLWGEYVLRSEFLPDQYLPSLNSKVILSPPQPLPITEDFDAINIWRFATSYSSQNRPQLNYTIQYRDSQGQVHSSPSMGGMLETGWGIHHRPVQPIKAPAEFISITFSGFNEARRVTYFDSLRFYTRSQAPIHDAEIPSWEELGLPLGE